MGHASPLEESPAGAGIPSASREAVTRPCPRRGRAEESVTVKLPYSGGWKSFAVSGGRRLPRLNQSWSSGSRAKIGVVPRTATTG